MLTRDMVLQRLREAPGSTNVQLAAFFGKTVGLMATKMKQYYDAGYIMRTEGPRSITGVQSYLYYALDGVVGRPKQERVRIAKQVGAKVPERALSQAPTPQIGPLDSIVNELANATTQQVFERVRRNLSDGIHNMLLTAKPVEVPTFQVDYTPICTVTQPPVDPTKPVLPKVGVAGMLPVQAGAIVERLGNKLDLTFWSADDAYAKLKTMAASCDVIFLHTRHISHATDNYLQACNAKIIRVVGSTSAMVERIQQYFISNYGSKD